MVAAQILLCESSREAMTGLQIGNHLHLRIVDVSSDKLRVLSLKDAFDATPTRELTCQKSNIVFPPKIGFPRATYVLQRLSPAFSLSTTACIGAFL